MLRAADDERPPESDAEAERIAEMRARMEAMFGGGEAPAAEPPSEEGAMSIVRRRLRSRHEDRTRVAGD